MGVGDAGRVMWLLVVGVFVFVVWGGILLFAGELSV